MENNMPEKVMCIDPGSKKLTLHKIYDVLGYDAGDSHDGVYKVTNDSGEIMRYYVFRFKPINKDSYSVELI